MRNNDIMYLNPFKAKFILIVITILLFLLPFTWMKNGFVDLGGDEGRIYYLDASSVLSTLYELQNPFGSSLYGIVPYLLILSLIQSLLNSPSMLVALEHGIQLSMAFYFMSQVINILLSFSYKKGNTIVNYISIVGGIAYIGLISKSGWTISLITLHQVFLNPLIFYLLILFIITSQYRYGIVLIIVTFLFSQNFSYTSSPQLLSFYPFSLLFLYIYLRFIAYQKIPWKKLFILLILFFGVHSFHYIPIVASILDKNAGINNYIFSKESIENAGLKYFDFNRQNWGKLSINLFQPNNWNSNFFFLLIIPIITVLGFIKEKSKLLSVTGFFFVITFFLVSANITLIGIRLYRQLFYIPGFLMFRSFYEKWYFVFAFFYVLLFAFALYLLVKNIKKTFAFTICCVVAIGIVIRIIPFIQGAHTKLTIYDSKNVPINFDIDPQLLESVSFIKKLPAGNVLTLPLTSAAYQVFYGKTNGAYIGLSLINWIGGKKDYPGFWAFGLFEKNLITSLKEKNVHQLEQILSLLNIKYIFWNTDSRIIDSFNSYPYYEFNMSELKYLNMNQAYYKNLLTSISDTNIYKNGHYSIEKISEEKTRPKLYIPDIIYASASGSIIGDSFKSAFLDEVQCDTTLICNSVNETNHVLTFNKISSTEYTFEIKITDNKPFLLVLLEDYHPKWNVVFNTDTISVSDNILANGYANSWIVNTSTFNEPVIISGRIVMNFRNYFVIGRIISIVSILIVFIYSLYLIFLYYAAKK